MLIDKDFKRLLKELGLYNKWKVARVKYEIIHPNEKKCFYEIRNKSLCHFIDSSFIWCETDDVNFWAEFSNAAENSIRWRSPKDFCCEEGIEYLKEHLKKYM
jgi:hypothetical protein